MRSLIASNFFKYNLNDEFKRVRWREHVAHTGGKRRASGF
jgi:hypothetical protein